MSAIATCALIFSDIFRPVSVLRPVGVLPQVRGSQTAHKQKRINSVYEKNGHLPGKTTETTKTGDFGPSTQVAIWQSKKMRRESGKVPKNPRTRWSEAKFFPSLRRFIAAGTVREKREI